MVISSAFLSWQAAIASVTWRLVWFFFIRVVVRPLMIVTEGMDLRRSPVQQETQKLLKRKGRRGRGEAQKKSIRSNELLLCYGFAPSLYSPIFLM